MESKSLVSILIPVYNAESFLNECLDSVVNQTYDNLQIVIVDDGSLDGSWDIMQEYYQKDNRIEIYQQLNKGVAATRNILLEKVKGNYILFVDSDDWLELNAIDESLAILKMNNADFVSFNQNENRLIKQEEAIKLFLDHRSFRGMLWNKLISRNLLSDCYFDERIYYGEDALFIWRILQKCTLIAFSDQKLYHYRLNENSISSSSFSKKKNGAYYVWRHICMETEQQWAKYLDVAYARYSIEMTLLLHDAARSSYRFDNSIKRMQQVVRFYGHLIRKTKLSSLSMSIYAWIASRSYSTICLLSTVY